AVPPSLSLSPPLSSSPPQAVSDTASTPAAIAAAALVALRVRGVVTWWSGDLRIRMNLLVLRITAPFSYSVVLRRTFERCPVRSGLRPGGGGGKSASRVKSGIVTPS